MPQDLPSKDELARATQDADAAVLALTKKDRFHEVVTKLEAIGADALPFLRVLEMFLPPPYGEVAVAAGAAAQRLSAALDQATAS